MAIGRHIPTLWPESGLRISPPAAFIFNQRCREPFPSPNPRPRICNSEISNPFAARWPRPAPLWLTYDFRSPAGSVRLKIAQGPPIHQQAMLLGQGIKRFDAVAGGGCNTVLQVRGEVIIR